jgi:hypothetical protein
VDFLIVAAMIPMIAVAVPIVVAMPVGRHDARGEGEAHGEEQNGREALGESLSDCGFHRRYLRNLDYSRAVPGFSPGKGGGADLF